MQKPKKSLEKNQAAIIIQKNLRRWVCMRKYHELLNQKYLEVIFIKIMKKS